VASVETQEQLYTSVMRGVSARADLALIGPKLAERREYLIRQAILDYQAKKLDGMGALLFVASLVENARLIDDLSFEDRKGQRSADRLTATTP